MTKEEIDKAVEKEIIEEHLRIEKVFESQNLIFGRMISFSKTYYRTEHPDNEVYFNANIFTEDAKIWWGDLDFTLDEPALKKVAQELKTDLYILRESDGRWDIDELTSEIIKEKAQKVVKYGDS